MTFGEGDSQPQNSALRIDDIRVDPRYTGQWIAAEVINYSKDGSPEQGIVLSSGLDDVLVADEARTILQDRVPKPKIAFFF